MPASSLSHEEKGVTANSAKRRMLEGKPAIGAEVGLGSPLSAELICADGLRLRHGRHAAREMG